MTVFYVDVSHHDWDRAKGELDWAAIRAATSPVMCARATYGDPGGLHYTTRHFGDFQNAARSAGFDLRGGYHNLVSGDQASINQQVDWFRGELDRYDCHWAMLDVERYPELVNNGRWPRWDDVAQFADRWHAVDARPLVFYIPGWLYSGFYPGKDLRTLGGPLVESDYGSNDAQAFRSRYIERSGDNGRGWQPYGNITPAIWQYGSKLIVPGASPATDVNAYRGTLEQLRTMLTGQTGDDDMATVRQEDWDALIWRVEAMANMTPTYGGGGSQQGKPVPFVAAIKALSGDQVDEAAIVAGVLAGLSPQAIADLVVAALPPDLARGVADELAARLQS